MNATWAAGPWIFEHDMQVELRGVAALDTQYLSTNAHVGVNEIRMHYRPIVVDNKIQ